MQTIDILTQYLYETQYKELKSDPEFQSAKAARDQTMTALTAAMSPEQVRLFQTYMEQENFLDALELRHFLSRCSLLLLPQSNP